MSDIYKQILLRQRKDDTLRTFVNDWISTNINENLRSLQDLVMDTECEFIPDLDDFEGDDEEFETKLQEALEKYYSRILEALDDYCAPIDIRVDESEDAVKEEPPSKPKKKPKPSVAEAINVLLASGSLDENRVREIVREEISSAIDQLVITIAK